MQTADLIKIRPESYGLTNIMLANGMHTPENKKQQYLYSHISNIPPMPDYMQAIKSRYVLFKLVNSSL